MGHCSGVGLCLEGGSLLGGWAMFRGWGSARRIFKMSISISESTVKCRTE